MGIFELEMRTGKQLFPIDYNFFENSYIKNKIKAIKIIIKNTYGGDKTYLNQIMLYENLFEDITLNESGYGINTIPHDEKILPKDFSSSQISNINESQKTINPTNKTNINDINKFIKSNNNSNSKKIIFNSSNQNMVKSIGDFISDDNNSQKSDEISFDEKYISKSRSKINSNKKENIQDEKEENEIITTSDDFKIPYKKNLNFYKNENIPKNNKKIPVANNSNNNNSNNIEKLLKQNILINNNQNINNFNNNNLKENKRLYEYKQILNKFSRDSDYNDNNNDEEDNRNNKYLTNTYSIMKFNNKYGIRSNRNSYIDKNNKTFYNDKIDTINNNMKFNAFTPNRFNYTGYDFLLNKKRAFTPNSNCGNLVNTPSINKVKIEEKENINNKNIISNNLNKDPAYEVLQNQLKDMEKHIKDMTINNEFQINPALNKYNNNINKTSLYYNNFLMEDKQQIKRNSIKSHNSFNSDNNNKNNFIKNNNNGYYSEISDNINNYNNINYSNNINNNIKKSNNNNIYSLQDLNTNGKMDINRRIENLEKCVFDIKDELNNLSDQLRVLFNRDEFMYNFKDAIKQVCFEFLNEKLNQKNFNNNNEEYNNYNEGEDENNEGQYNDQKNNSQYSENIDENNYNNNYYNNNYNNQNYQNNNTMSNTANKFEIEINKKIDEKLNYLSENIKNQIYEKFLQPSISEIEQTMKQNIDEIKGKVDAINNNPINTNNNIIKTNKEENDLDEEDYELQAKYGMDYKDSIYNKASSKMRKEKYEEINRLGEKLYDKLLEKEKKLQLLKKETSLLMNEHNSKNNIFDNSQNY